MNKVCIYCGTKIENANNIFCIKTSHFFKDMNIKRNAYTSGANIEITREEEQEIYNKAFNKQN